MQETLSSSCRGCANCPAPGTTCSPKPGSIEARVIAVAERVLCHPVPQGPNMLSANFVQDLGADSIDLVELVMAMEDEFEIEVSDDVASRIPTLQAAVDHIKLLLGDNLAEGTVPSFAELIARTHIPQGTSRASLAIQKALQLLLKEWEASLRHRPSKEAQVAMKVDIEEAIALLSAIKFKLS